MCPVWKEWGGFGQGGGGERGGGVVASGGGGGECRAGGEVEREGGEREGERGRGRKGNLEGKFLVYAHALQ